MDWYSGKSEVLLNPRMPSVDKKVIMDQLEKYRDLSGHIWIASSGSSGSFKLFALSKKAILISARAVNRHLESHSHDVWFNPLPIFHVGGLGILARAFVSGASYVSYEADDLKWDPLLFVKQLESCAATLTSLVPTQIFDLVSLKIRSPALLRVVVVGGGHLSESLYFQAIALGWHVLPSYGLTECCSQVATAALYSSQTLTYPALIPLDHVELKTCSDGYLSIKSDALLTGYIKSFDMIDPKNAGWFKTEDLVELSSDGIRKISRGVDLIKIGGENVSLSRLDAILESILFEIEYPYDAALCVLPDARLGHTIHLAVTKQSGLTSLIIKRFAEKVLPFERIKHYHWIEEIPRSSLKKIIRPVLAEKIQSDFVNINRF